MGYRSLSDLQKARVDPMITAFNATDMYSAGHTRRVLLTFPGVFSYIGEFSVRRNSSRLAVLMQLETETKARSDRFSIRRLDA